MINFKHRFINLLLILMLSIVARTKTTTTSRSSYTTTSTYSYSSGSSSSGKWALSTENCIIVSVWSVVGFILIFAWVTIWICICKRMSNRAYARNQQGKLSKKDEDMIKMIRQREEASKIEKMHHEMELQAQGSMFSTNQTAFTISPASTDHPNSFIMPGTTVQPKYIDVNPYSGHYNNNIVPVFYNPADYGVVYDKPIIYQQPAASSPTYVVPQEPPASMYYTSHNEAVFQLPSQPAPTNKVASYEP